MTDIGVKWIEENQEFLTSISDQIWSFAETAYNEVKSAQLMQETVEKAGFRVTKNIAGILSAFKAEWGYGSPRIGFLAEYDASPNLGQKVATSKETTPANSSGHGCGHNLLGTGVLGGALALVEEMKEKELAGTVVFYGCPAEEELTGKVFMAREGVFNDLDLALTWHPLSLNMASLVGTQAADSVKFNFKGVTSHAAFDPENGRSAQDAVELMNVGANYLREHISSDCRLHYAITETGRAPNIVPDFAQVWYYIRANKRSKVTEVYDRLLKIAEGAALMTETSVTVDKIGGCYNLNANKTIAEVYLESLKKVGAPVYSEQEHKFAQELTDNFPKDAKQVALQTFGLPESMMSNLFHNDVVPVLAGNKSITTKGSSDVGDVSWIVPTASFFASTSPLGTPAHSWQNTASSGMSIGHKGMMTAAKVLALTGIKFMESRELVKAAKEELREDTKYFSYESPIPDHVSYRKI